MRCTRAILGGLGGGPLPARIEGELFGRVCREFARLAPDAAEATRTLAARVTASGFLGLLRGWLDEDGAASSDAVSDAFVAMTLPGVARSLGCRRSG